MTTANRSATFALIILVGITLAATALAQVDGAATGAVQTNNPLALTLVDQGTADLGDLTASNRLIPIDLRQPLDFRDLYEAPDDSGRLMRVSGALSAVFARSEYIASGRYLFPLIPAGTEFYIGPIPVTAPTFTEPMDWTGEGNSPNAGFGLIDGRLNLDANGMTSNRLDGSNPLAMRRIHASASATPADLGLTLEALLTGRYSLDTEAKTPVAPSIWSSERYRQSRVATLLARAQEHRRGS